MRQALNNLIAKRLTKVSVAGALTIVALSSLLLTMRSSTTHAQGTLSDITVVTMDYGTTTTRITFTTDEPAITRLRYLRAGAVSPVPGGPTSPPAPYTRSNLEVAPFPEQYDTDAGDIDAGTANTNHEITVTGLNPDTRYFYEIIAVSEDGLTEIRKAGRDIPPGPTYYFYAIDTKPVQLSNIKAKVDVDGGGNPIRATISSDFSPGVTSAVIHIGLVAGGLTDNVACALSDSFMVGATTYYRHADCVFTTGDAGLNVTVPSRRYFFEYVYSAGGPAYGAGQHYFYTGPLHVTGGPSTPMVADHSAQIIWNTDLEASHEIAYDYAGTSPLSKSQTSLASNSTNHSVTIASGLDSGTTYDYTVTSRTKCDIICDPPSFSVTSGVVQFTTSGLAPGTPLLFTSGPSVTASSDEATVNLGTNIPTTVLVEYNVNPGLSPDPKSSGYTQACNDPAVCVAPPPKWIAPPVAATSHAVKITGLTTPDRFYYYRVTVKDTSGRTLGTGVLKFRSAVSPFDHKFSTGDCSDGTKIGECTPDGKFCRPGGIGPVFDCRPGKTCTYTCPLGSTCVDTGDCINDPPPGDALTACNPASCYMKCNGASGDKAGKRCSFDSDCGGGKCIVGTFTIPAAPGCYQSWTACSANVVLKVSPDRVCNKWYTCKSSLQAKITGGKTQNQCLDLTICDSMSPNGQCNNLLEGRQCSNDPLRFCNDDTDCVGTGAYCLSEGERKTMTYLAPEEVGQIKGLTGYAFAGLDWHGAYKWDAGVMVPTPAKVNGNYPLSLANQVGNRVSVVDGDFENYGLYYVCSKQQSKQCSPSVLPGDTMSCADSAVPPKDYGPCVPIRDTQRYIARYWKTVDIKGSSYSPGITVDVEGSSSTRNQMLKITPTDFAETGAMTTQQMALATQPNAQYMIRVRMKSTADGQLVHVSFVNAAGDERFFPIQALTTSWQTYFMGPVTGIGGEDTSIAFKTADQSDTPVPFWIDDLEIIPALVVSDAGAPIPQTCRIYPNDSAPSCSFTDAAGISYGGLKGYCLERDPLNAAICLSWWPVDIVSGDRTFGTDQAAGYNDRQPLYACMQTEGNWNQKDPIYNSTSFAGDYCVSGDSAHAEVDIFPGKPSGTGNLCGVPYGPYRPMTTSMVLPVPSGGAGPCNDIENIGACRSYTFHGFCFCSRAGFGGWKDANATDQKIHKYDVEYFRVHMLRYNRNGDSTWPNTGDLILNEANGWSAKWGIGNSGTNAEDQGGAGECLGEYIKLDWDPVDQHLRRIYFYAQRCANSDNAASGFAASGLFFMKERCTQLVQVADESTATAWTDRTSKAGTFVLPNLNYRYITDMPPVGTAATPSVLLDPDEWQSLVPAPTLSVEAPDTAKAYPYQIRAGSSYACKGNCSGRLCTNPKGAKVGQACFTSDDCTDSSVSPPIFGKCVGNGVCAAYDPDKNQYYYQYKDPDGKLSDRKAPQSCTWDYVGGKKCDAKSGRRAGTACLTDSECQYTAGKCINPGPSGYCDANSGVRKGFLCGDDKICQTTYNGKCVDAGYACTAASGAKSGQPCSGPSDTSTCTSTSGKCTQKTCNAASGKAEGYACTQDSDCSVVYLGLCDETKHCDANSAPGMIGADCSADSTICVSTAVGACVDNGVLRCDKSSSRVGSACTVDGDCEVTSTGSCIAAPGGCPSGQNCCQFRGEVCIGGFASDRTAQKTAANPASLTCENAGAYNGLPCKTIADCGTSASRTCSGNTQYFGQYNLMRYFAKAYSFWQWNDVEAVYELADYVCGPTAPASVRGRKCEPDTSDAAKCAPAGCIAQTKWNPPTIECKACVGGDYPKLACTLNASCKGGGACAATLNHPEKSVPTEPGGNADYCAVKPRLFNIVSAEQPVLIDEGSAYMLKFNTSVNEEQLPLTEIEIDWGDGSALTADTGLKIAPRENPKVPHVYTHTYHCSGKGVCNPYQIRLRIKDNWGWCSNGNGAYGIPCSDNSQARCDKGTNTCSGGSRDKLACSSDDNCLAWTKGPIIQVIH